MMNAVSHSNYSSSAGLQARQIVAGVLFAIGVASLLLPFLGLMGIVPANFLARSHQLMVAHGAFVVALAFAYGCGYRPARIGATIYLAVFALLSLDVLLGFGVDGDESELAASLSPGLVAALICAAAAAAFNFFSDDVKRAFALRG
jgi:hypothetical protein